MARLLMERDKQSRELEFPVGGLSRGGRRAEAQGLESGRDDLRSDQKVSRLRWEEVVMQLLWEKLLAIRIDTDADTLQTGCVIFRKGLTNGF